MRAPILINGQRINANHGVWITQNNKLEPLLLSDGFAIKFANKMKFELEIPDPDFELKPNEVIESRDIHWGILPEEQRIVDRAFYCLTWRGWQIQRGVPLEWQPNAISFEIVTKEPKLSWLRKHCSTLFHQLLLEKKS